MTLQGRIILGGLFIVCCLAVTFGQRSSREIRYVALGDSYTAGTGASPQESWPVVLTERLKFRGLNIRLVVNLVRSAWTTQKVIDQQLPVYKSVKPDFATILIGANDLVQGVPAAVFRRQFCLLLDEMLKVLSPKNRLVVVTIPDFSQVPGATQFSMKGDIASGIREFNQIITQEARNRKVTVVDIFQYSQRMKADTSLVCADGLHPSAKEYALWAEFIAQAIIPQVFPRNGLPPWLLRQNKF